MIERMTLENELGVFRGIRCEIGNDCFDEVRRRADSGVAQKLAIPRSLHQRDEDWTRALKAAKKLRFLLPLLKALASKSHNVADTLSRYSVCVWRAIARKNWRRQPHS